MRYFWITVLAASLAAQTIDVRNGDESTPLAGVWKEKTSDDLRWADPALDDSFGTTTRSGRQATPAC